jgi:hypothetical protein
MTTEKPYRQGDVYLRPISDSVDLSGLKQIPPEPRGTILAHGEVTGHAHVLDPTAVELYPLPEHLQTDMTRVSNGRILRVIRETSLKHEEHDAISLLPGDYYIGIQIEHSDDDQWRRVAD